MVSDKRIINAMVLFSLDILWSFANTLISGFIHLKLQKVVL